MLVPANCTNRLQPFDLSVNKAAKEYLRGEFQIWYAKQISQQVQVDSEIKPVDLRTLNCCQVTRDKVARGFTRLSQSKA